MLRNFLILIVTLLLLAGLWMAGQRYGLSNLPGTYEFRLGNSQVAVPILSCIVISVLLSLLFRFLRRD
jgi:hypothetical protein